MLRVQDASGAILVEEEVWPREGGGFELDLALEPGRYRVEASRVTKRAEADLIVEPEGGPAELALELR
jgi:hypothetical protein